MKNLIRQILRESDWDWVEGIPERFYTGQMFYHYQDEDNWYKILEVTDEYDIYLGRPRDTMEDIMASKPNNIDKEEWLIDNGYSRIPINKFEEMVDNGVWIETTGLDI